MRHIDVDELKRIQLEILKYVASFCEENNIKYWIDFGTLLGAVRHKGYIPWDDDIDIGMLRIDYDKFLALFNKNDSCFFVSSIETDDSFLFPYAKIMDRRTVLYEPDQKGFKYSVYIDLFVYDNAPSNHRLQKKKLRKRDFYKTMRLIQLGMLKPKNMFKRIAVAVISFMTKPFKKNYFTKKIIENSKKGSSKYMDTNLVGDFTSTSYKIYDADLFKTVCDVEFEGLFFKAPKDYDKYLTMVYGDYMTPPPPSERESKHFFDAYYDN